MGEGEDNGCIEEPSNNQDLHDITRKYEGKLEVEGELVVS